MTTTRERMEAKLRDLGFKQQGNTWRGNSPLRAGSNSGAFCVTFEGDEKGAYIDHAREEDKGSLYDLCARLGIETPKGERTEVADTKRAYRDLADYAAAHGLTADILKQAGWSEAEMIQGRPALAFKTATGTRYRFIDGQHDRDNPPYKSPLKYQACWYGLKRALAMIAGNWQPLVLCNGEISTLAAQHYGIPACAVTGGEKILPEALVAELKTAYPAGAVMLAYDCDAKGRSVAEKVKVQLENNYDVTVLDLGLGDKGDLADFCMLHTEDALSALMDLPDTPPKPAVVVTKDAMEALADAARELSAVMRQDEKTRQQDDLELVLAKLQAEIDRVRMNHSQPLVKTFQQLVDENTAMLDYMRQHPDPVRGLKSRIVTLDKAIGGFTPEVYVIYGDTGMGKSTLGISIVSEFIKQAPGLVVSTESPPNRWLVKLVAKLTRVPNDRIESGQLSPDEYERVKAAYDLLRSHQCSILDHGSPTPGQVRAAFLAGQKAHGFGWVLIDSSSKMSYPGANGIYDITRGVSNGIQDLYREMNVPVLVTSQIGRDVKEPSRRGRRIPQLDDAYGGGVIEHNAGVVMGLYYHQYYVDAGLEEPNALFPPDMTLVRLLKSRWTPGGRTTSIPLTNVGGAGFYDRIDIAEVA
jgi:replicative DNA helicase